MNTAVGVTSGKRFYFVGAYKVEVARNCMFKSRSSNGKFERVGLVVHCQETVDKAT